MPQRQLLCLHIRGCTCPLSALRRSHPCSCPTCFDNMGLYLPCALCKGHPYGTLHRLSHSDGCTVGLFVSLGSPHGTCCELLSAAFAYIYRCPLL